jgi:hypothetical protein
VTTRRDLTRLFVGWIARAGRRPARSRQSVSLRLGLLDSVDPQHEPLTVRKLAVDEALAFPAVGFPMEHERAVDPPAGLL